ncbi:MAG: helix-turn-helix transcriptional regulator [Candidatus Competibacteraceae bacterium]|nr:helix-turn-helix transcriptional regulator [Candidatus Competibacteraceae bacterium]
MWFSHRQPSESEPYPGFVIGRMDNRWCFRRWLPSGRRRSRPARWLTQSRLKYTLAGRLRRALRTLLLTRQSSLEQVARLFALPRRTLNRRLEEKGATFQGLVNEVRYEIARQLLEDTRMSMGQIAAILDYNDASAFTRAFRRWSGQTPTAWRARLPIKN